MKPETGNPARGWFHGAAWLGLGATVYTNYRSAPVHDLQVAYLAVPVLAAGVAEGLIRNWQALPASVRVFLAGVLFALLATSYEHFRSLTLASGGTWFAGNVGSAVIDVAIFGCVLATCVLSERLPVSAPAPEAVPVSVPTPEAVPVSAPVPELVVSVPEYVELVPEVHAPRIPVSVPVPEFAGPPATEPPFVPEFRNASPEDFRPIPEAPVSPVPVSGAPTSGARAAKRDADLQLMMQTFGEERPSAPEIMHALKCGGSRATRLRDMWIEYLEQ